MISLEPRVPYLSDDERRSSNEIGWAKSVEPRPGSRRSPHPLWKDGDATGELHHHRRHDLGAHMRSRRQQRRASRPAVRSPRPNARSASRFPPPRKTPRTGATRVRVEAKAEREAAADRSVGIREIAEAEAAPVTIRAEATKKLAKAQGQTALIAAENALSPEIIELKLVIARLEALPKIIATMVKPAEKIESIRINQITGLGTVQGVVLPAPPPAPRVGWSTRRSE